MPLLVDLDINLTLGLEMCLVKYAFAFIVDTKYYPLSLQSAFINSEYGTESMWCFLAFLLCAKNHIGIFVTHECFLSLQENDRETAFFL